MASLLQVCERRYGESECPFHPGYDVVALCVNCKTLVCLKCITSKNHQGHTFTELKNTLTGNCDIIGHFIEHIQLKFLPDLHQKVKSFKKENKVNKLKLELKNTLTLRYVEIMDLINTQMQNLENQIEKICDENSAKLQDSWQIMEQDLIKCVTELRKVLEEQSPVKVYDASQNVLQMKKKIALLDEKELDHVKLVFNTKDMQELVKDALGEIKILPSHCCLQGSSRKKCDSPKHFQEVCATTVISNEDPMYSGITPLTEDTAWCKELLYDKATYTHYITNKICMIDSKGHAQKRLETSDNVRRLHLHPSNGVLYGTFTNNTICAIDTSTGNTNTIVRCSYEPDCFSITPDGDIIVGERTTGYVYKYTSDGQQLHQSKEKYDVWDISCNAMNNQLAVACYSDGVTVMDGTLAKVIHVLKIVCATLTYDVDGSLMIGDWDRKEILILEKKTFFIIKSIKLTEMISSPLEISLCGNSIWVTFKYPHKLLHVTFK